MTTRKNNLSDNSAQVSDHISRRALIAGGTGLVGENLLTILAGEPQYAQVISLVRREIKTVGKVESRIVSFENLENVELPEIDDAFCCLGTMRKAAGTDAAFRKVDFEYVLDFARAAKKAGAARFILVSSIGADAHSKFLYTRVKGEIEAAIIALGFEVVGIARPSFLTGQRGENRLGEAVAILAGKIISPLLIGPLRSLRPIEARTVARGLVHLAFNAPDGVTILSSAEITDAAAAN